MLIMEDSWENLVSQWEMDEFFHCNEEEFLKDMIVQQPESNPSSSFLQSNMNFKPSSFPTGYVLSFDNPNFEAHQNHSSKSMAQRQNSIPEPRTQHHILAERKRREELTKNIMELSAMIPGLKKTDKITVVREAVNYLKRLQEQVKELENQKRQQCMNSTSLIKKSNLFINDYVEQEVPQMKISLLDKEVLIGIYCQNPNYTLLKVFVLLHNLHLSVTCSSVLPFGTSTFKLTIIAKMDDEHNMIMDDLIKALRVHLQSLKSEMCEV